MGTLARDLLKMWAFSMSCLVFGVKLFDRSRLVLGGFSTGGGTLEDLSFLRLLVAKRPILTDVLIGGSLGLGVSSGGGGGGSRGRIGETIRSLKDWEIPRRPS